MSYLNVRSRPLPSRLAFVEDESQDYGPDIYDPALLDDMGDAEEVRKRQQREEQVVSVSLVQLLASYMADSSTDRGTSHVSLVSISLSRSPGVRSKCSIEGPPVVRLAGMLGSLRKRRNSCPSKGE